MKVLKVIIIFCILVFLRFTGISFAQNGISVTPSIIYIDLANDAPEYKLEFKNNTKSNLTLTLSSQDFNQLEDTHRINFLEGRQAQNYKYGLSSWISFENKTIRLSPNEAKKITVFINKDKITKGGHYASILAEIEAEEVEKKVNVKAVLSSLLFVRASTGLEVEEGKILTVTPFRARIEFPESFTTRYENSGNVYTTPYGVINVYDLLGNQIASNAFNQDSLVALPESVRSYKVDLKRLPSLILPGFYKAKVDLSFGKTKQKTSKEVTFFTQGSFDFGKIAFIILVLTITTVFLKRRKL